MAIIGSFATLVVVGGFFPIATFISAFFANAAVVLKGAKHTSKAASHEARIYAKRGTSGSVADFGELPVYANMTANRQMADE
jgi:hypothetical protein